MTKEITNMKFCEEKLDEDKHFKEISDFVCGENESLEIFLKCHAIKYHNSSQGMTYIIKMDNKVIAFYTLKCNAVQVEDTNGKECIPMVELARLAVDSEYQCKGYGTVIFLGYMLPKILHVRDLVAAKAIMVFVEKEDKNAINFYKKVGFKMADEKVQNHIEEWYSEGCSIMVLNLDTAEEILRQIQEGN